MALMVLALAVDARGQRLLETDGVELRGEAQLVMSGGGTCNVLESDTAYEANKANDGAPMDIWRLDFSVRNGSGRWLDHLIARFQIDSEWPDCTNWSYPPDSEFRALNPDVPLEDLPIGWSGTIGFIQETGRNVVAPGETLTDTEFFTVLRGDPEPQFTNWSMDFDFAVNPPPAATSAVAPGRPSAGQQPAAATAQQENLFWQSIMNSTDPAEFAAYLAQFPNGVFRMLAENRLEALRAPVGDSPAAGVAAAEVTENAPLEPTCAGQPEGAACWMEVANQPECYVWNLSLQTDASATWSGACSEGWAQGTGTLTWSWVRDSEQQTSELTGRLQEGQRHGDWVSRHEDGTVSEGPFVEGERHANGDWVIRRADGTVYEGPFVEGQLHGDWVIRRADGTVENVTVRNDERVNNGAAQQTERVSLLFWSAEPTEDHGRFRIYIDGQELVNRNVWGAWRGDPPTCNYREEHPEGVPNFVLVTMDPGQYRIRAVAERRGFYVLDAQGFGSGVAFAIEDTLDLTPGCHVYELVRTN